MPNITPFNFESNEIRVVRDDNGEPWFVAADVCAVLGIKNPSDAISKLDADEKAQVVDSNTVGLTEGTRINNLLNTINESGLYTLVLRCRDATKPGTTPHRFRKWVTSEVLPSIRKTGSYSVHAPASIPQIELEERTFNLAERIYQTSEQCTDPVLSLLFLDKAKNLMGGANDPALPSPERAYFQVYEILQELGYSDSAISKIASPVGRRVAKAYRQLVGQEPETVKRYVQGAVRDVKIYPADFCEEAMAVAATYLHIDEAA